MLFKHEGGAISLLHCTLFGHSPCDAYVTGENADHSRQVLHAWPLHNHGKRSDDQTFYEEEQTGYEGFCHQITHFAFCVENRVLESPIRPLSDSIATLRSMDSVRNQLGILFDEEHVERGSTTP